MCLFLFIDFVLPVYCFQLVYFKFKLLLFKQAHVHVHVDIHMHTDIYVHMLILFVILHYTMRLQISQSAWHCMHGFCVSAKLRSYFLAAAATSYGFNYGIACRNVRHLITGSDITEMAGTHSKLVFPSLSNKNCTKY